jgi:glycosyltransferase involved in cell wall biosynthesis
MKLSIVIPVYNSHGVFERQLKHFSKMDLSDVEIIIADDNSNPPLESSLDVVKIYNTNSQLAWTQGLGRNLGASKATGEYLLMTDIDHILTQKIIDCVRDFNGDFMRFPRHFGILDENGELKTDRESLTEYGIADKILKKEVLDTNIHRNTFAISRELFDLIGGYAESWCTYGYHPKARRGDDCYFEGAWRRQAKKAGLKQDLGPIVYVFPNGRFHKDGELNPHGLFHDLHHREERSFK